MNNYLSKTKPFVLVLIFSIVLLNTSCDKEEKGEQPELPPVESMMMYFTDFASPPGVKGLDQKVVEYTYENFGYAYGQLYFWSYLTLSKMAIPVGAYTYALQQEPSYLGNNTWEWSYTVTVEQQEFIATLTGKRINNESFSMVMNLALSSLPLVKMKYFEGECRYDHTAASWEIYEFGDISSEKVIDIAWTKDFETGDLSLKYTYVKAGEEETNHAITYVYDPTGEYDAGYYIDKQDSETDIEWLTTTKEGRVRKVSILDGFDWRYWNQLLQDVVQ